ncbi:MAG: DUF3597 domain-containing protein [Croceibacterium sp.]
MGIFSSIRDAIFGHKAAAQPIPQAQAGAPATAPQPQPGAPVDVEAQLDAMPGADNLNWRTSIVDLMKLVGLDSSFAHRQELAKELGRTDYSGSAEDNIWLHKATMQQLADNGGKVPASMLA